MSPHRAAQSGRSVFFSLLLIAANQKLQIICRRTARLRGQGLRFPLLVPAAQGGGAVVGGLLRVGRRVPANGVRHEEEGHLGPVAHAGVALLEAGDAVLALGLQLPAFHQCPKEDAKLLVRQLGHPVEVVKVQKHTFSFTVHQKTSFPVCSADTSARKERGKAIVAYKRTHRSKFCWILRI